jgi:hypothetical protein
MAAIASRPDAILDAVVDALDGLQSLIHDHGDRIASIDVNPMLVNGENLVAVDALVITR